MKTKLLIVADDLTGGLDSGVQLAKKGIKVKVYPEPDPEGSWTKADAEVIVAVSETRHLKPEAAFETVYRIVSLGKAAGIPHIYKKTDSALRGNIGAELSAALKASGAEVLPFLPAYPAMDRLTVGGQQLIGGVPVALSVFGKDPFDPVTESDVTKIISAQTDTPVFLEGEGKSGIIVMDAGSDEELRDKGRKLAKEGSLTVSAGCAGFAEFLPELLGLEGQDKSQYNDMGDGLMVISGSLNPFSLKQLDHAEGGGFLRTHLSAEEVADPVQMTKGDFGCRWVIVDSGGDEDHAAMDELAEKMGWSRSDLSSRISLSLGERFAEAERTFNGTIMVIGGDTLISCLRRIGCGELEPVAELYPGVVLSKYRTERGEKLLISKSGGFGEETLLTDLKNIIEQKIQTNSVRLDTMEDINRERPIIAITMGDPASIGPELSVKALAHKEIYEICRPLIVGDLGMLEKAMTITGLEGYVLNRVAALEEGVYEHGTIDVLDMGLVDKDSLPIGAVSWEAGEAAFRYVEKAIGLAMSGEADATVTNALNKEAINLAGHHFAGHTEIYAKYTGTEKYTMMLAHGDLRVVHVSTHVSLREACDRVKKDRVLEVIRIAWKACRDLGIESPRVGVAGLNPHSGENGLFGREEIDEIIPAIREAQAEGIDCDGPVPPDTVFSKARGGWYDIVVAMYHDQGHIPLKVVGFVYDRDAGAWQSVEGVNITLGLPIIRVSVDHGTAFDQAGQGTADPSSLLNAITYAARLAASKK